MGLIAEIYKKMQTKFLDIGFKVPPNHFAQVNLQIATTSFN
jgi:hypothetical protein